MFMRKIFFIALLLVGSQAFAQESIMGEINYEFLEKLITLAKENYPQSKIVKIQESRSKSAVAATKVSYLDLINVSYFYRPENRTALNPENPFIFNGFQVGLSLSPGVFFQKPSEVKQAKAEYEIAMLQSKSYDATLENEVKSRYYNYVQLFHELRIRTQEAQDNKVSFETVRNSYESGEAELEDYNQGKATLTQAGLTLVQTEISYLKAKDALEEMIGRKIEDVK